jgi:sodium transport system permease protein
VSAPGFATAARTVFAKEVRENGRDRRTLLSALILGPLVAPLLFALMIHATVERGAALAMRPLRIAVAGGQEAPALLDFLRGAGVEILPRELDTAALRAAVAAHREKLVLALHPDYGARLRQGRPAPVTLFVDSSNRDAEPDRRRVEALLHAFSAELGATRLRARGLDPAVSAPLAVAVEDVATAADRAALLLGMLSYFLLLAVLVGGLYIAIDTTAGERERGSLEALLTTPASRLALLTGKIAAASFYMALSLAVSVAAFAVALHYAGLGAIGMRANFGPVVALLVYAVMLPFVPLGAALLTLIASYTRSYREAQTWLSVVLLVPTLPIVFASLYVIEPRLPYYAVPSLGQHLLITQLLRTGALPAVFYAISALSSLVLAALFGGLALRRWRQEALLG